MEIIITVEVGTFIVFVKRMLLTLTLPMQTLACEHLVKFHHVSSSGFFTIERIITRMELKFQIVLKLGFTTFNLGLLLVSSQFS
jgi:hypothetical protein